MSTPFESIPGEISNDLKSISIELIKKNNYDVQKTVENFFSEAAARSKKGEKPNADFGLVAQDLTLLLPYYDQLNKLKVGKNLTNNAIYNNLIYDNMSKMNDILNDYTFKTPNPITLTPEQEIFGIKQALIELENKVPSIKDKKTREDVLWNINYLNSILTQGNTNVNSI